ncbi:hypothetical protein FEM54_21820 [Pseudomonas edaphica]|uniref:DUF805 domain-containing protein n=1 Tax=Pseudomonas edaphica TaxID=2006980 RepID=A0ABY2U0Y3_9PSED|nr:hypothetical protein FEM54_21820 [Pseudomonas edaphica]
MTLCVTLWDAERPGLHSHAERGNDVWGTIFGSLIVPTLCVVTPLVTLCVTLWDAERPGLHSHAERGNDLCVSDFQKMGHLIIDLPKGSSPSLLSVIFFWRSDLDAGSGFQFGHGRRLRPLDHRRWRRL